MAPAPWQDGGKPPTLLGPTPPSARTGRPRRWPAFASAAERTTPRGRAPGWLAVAQTGDRNARSAPPRRARRSSAGPCAELVTSARCRSQARRPAGQRPPRKCSPAPTEAARRASPATTRRCPKRRQSFATVRASAARPGALSCRNTTPVSPRGRPRDKAATAAQTSGTRTSSVNSHNTGCARVLPTRLRSACAQSTSRTMLTHAHPVQP